MSKLKSILLKFQGPLQSWGTSSNFETRHTDDYPSKSGVLGMLAAALGYRRHEDEKINGLREINFATRVDQAGILLRDYQIAKKYKKDGRLERNYVTNRYYLSDAIFLVVLSHEDNDFIDKIYEALKRPYFQNFLGRRSCPVNYDFIMGCFEEDPLKLLKKTKWQANKFYRQNKDNNLKIYGDSKILKTGKEKLKKDDVVSFSQKERKFQYRGESTIYVEVDRDVGETDHDAFGAVGG